MQCPDSGRRPIYDDPILIDRPRRPFIEELPSGMTHCDICGQQLGGPGSVHFCMSDVPHVSHVPHVSQMKWKGVCRRCKQTRDRDILKPRPEGLVCDLCEQSKEFCTGCDKRQDAYTMRPLPNNEYMCHHCDRTEVLLKEAFVTDDLSPEKLRHEHKSLTAMLLEDPRRPEHKKIRKLIKVIRKRLKWNICEWCSTCTRPLVKSNSEKGSKLCNLCRSPDVEKVHSDPEISPDMMKKLGF